MLNEKSNQAFVLTDIGRDVDDALALCVLEAAQKRNEIELVGVSTTHAIPEIRAQIVKKMFYNFNRDIPVGIGSKCPLEEQKNDEYIRNYLMAHAHLFKDRRSYEGLGLRGLSGQEGTFQSSSDILGRELENAARTRKKLTLLLLAPLTDIALFMEKDAREVRRNVESIYFMGNAKIDDSGNLIPDSVGYNVSVDIEAAKLVFTKLQEGTPSELGSPVPITVVGKWAAYQSPLSKKDFTHISDTGHPNAKYLLSNAVAGLMNFERGPLNYIFTRLYSNGKTPSLLLEHVDYYSNPYDAIAVLAWLKPELFIPQVVGRNKLIGMIEESSGVVDPARLKKQLLDNILFALHIKQNSDHIRPLSDFQDGDSLDQYLGDLIDEMEEEFNFFKESIKL